MSELKFDLDEWKQTNGFTEVLGAEKSHWDYLVDEDKFFDGDDPDSSEYTWEKVYKKIYTSKDWRFWSIFNFEKIKGKKIRTLEKKNGKPMMRYFAWAIRDKKCYEDIFGEEEAEQWLQWKNVKIAGDVDFNFKKDGKNQKYGYYRELIENKMKNNFSEEEREKYLCKLEWCEKRFHSLENFSLMFTPGGMNNSKNTKRDRIDRFIFQLREYFEKGDKKIFSHARGNKKVLEAYLSLFKDIYDYCEKIYKMDEDMVEQFLESGEKEDFKTGEDVVKFMRLAEIYWRKKHDLIFHV